MKFEEKHIEDSIKRMQDLLVDAIKNIDKGFESISCIMVYVFAHGEQGARESIHNLFEKLQQEEKIDIETSQLMSLMMNGVLKRFALLSNIIQEADIITANNIDSDKSCH